MRVPGQKYFVPANKGFAGRFDRLWTGIPLLHVLRDFFKCIL